MFKTINITKGYKVLVDNEDFEKVNQYKWQAKVTSRNVHARRSIKMENKRIPIGIPHLILNLHHTVLVDHINGNGLDNRKENLRIANKADNARNAKKRIDNVSGYKGVYKFNSKKWRALIGFNGKRIHLGLFENIKDAALAYDRAALKYFGQFAKLNFERNI